MTGRLPGTCFALFCLVMPAFVSAAQGQANLDRKTTIDVTAASPQDVYGSLARVLGCELALAPQVQGTVTMKIPNVTVRTALNAISESLGNSWHIEGGRLIVEVASGAPVEGAAVGRGVGSGVGAGIGPGRGSGIGPGLGGGVSGGVPGGVPGGVVGGTPRAKKIDIKERLDRKTPADFRFDNASVDDVLNAFGKIVDLEVRIQGLEAGKRVTLDLGNRTVFSALQAICHQVGGKGLILVLAADGTKKAQIKVAPGKPGKSGKTLKATHLPRS
jgi:type II secretory pathway component GspD/PulD (secretin)